MRMGKQMILTVLVISVALGAKTELCLGIVLAVLTADRALVL